MHKSRKGMIMLISRKRMRENTFRLLFVAMLNDSSVEEIIGAAAEAQLNADELETDEEVRAFASEVLLKTDELDEIIRKYSAKRSASRMPASTMAILKLALYELNYTKQIEPSIVISEALRLDKKYAGKEESRFINGLLGAYVRDMGLSTESTQTQIENDEQEQ